MKVPGFGNKYIAFPNKYSGMEEKFTKERSSIERDDHLSKYYEITEEIKVVELQRMVAWKGEQLEMKNELMRERLSHHVY